MTIFGLRIADFTFGIGIAWLAGVLIGDTNISWWLVVPAAALIFIGATFFLSFHKVAKPALAFALSIFLGIFYCHLYANWNRYTTHLVFNEDRYYTGIITEEPIVSPKFTLLTVSMQKPFAGTVTILAPPESSFHYGDILSIDGVITPADAPGTNPVMYMPHVSVLEINRGFWLREKLIDLKKSAIGRFQIVFSNDEAGLLGATLFADSKNIPAGLDRMMTRSGTIYLITMYGWKIGMISFFIANALSGKLQRGFIAITTTLITGMFIMMVGFPVSAVRAGIMALFVIIARETGWEADIRNILVYTAAGILIFDPLAIINDIGFVLSFASIIGIIYIAPAIRQLLNMHDAGIFGWKESICMAISAQLMVAPIIIRVFGEFPIMGIFAGGMVMMTMPNVMLFGWIFVGIGGSFPALSFFIAEILKMFLGYERTVITFFSRIAIPVQIANLSLWAIVVYYGALIFLLRAQKFFAKGSPQYKWNQRE